MDDLNDPEWNYMPMRDFMEDEPEEPPVIPGTPDAADEERKHGPPPPPNHPIPRLKRKRPGIELGRAAMRVAPSPVKPSKREVEEHWICHIPYAAWCSCCVASRALDDAHREADVEHPKEFPVLSMDWCFFGQTEAPETLPTLVIRDSQSKAIVAHGIQGKPSMQMRTELTP